MRAHPFRPFDAVAGLALVLVGVLVAVFGFENVDDDNLVLWCSIGAVVIGLAMLPWPRGRRETSPPSLPDESSPDD